MKKYLWILPMTAALVPGMFFSACFLAHVVTAVADDSLSQFAWAIANAVAFYGTCWVPLMWAAGRMEAAEVAEFEAECGPKE